MAGVSFDLVQNGTVVGSASSGPGGLVNFGSFPPGTYTLIETSTPGGFVPLDPATVIIYPDGTVTINGLPSSTPIANTPIFAVDFLKVNEFGSPLPGAYFTLTQNGTVVGSAVSDANGLVDFGTLPPGTYTLIETVGPQGYRLREPMTVVVLGNGHVTIDGHPASVPVVNISADDEIPPTPARFIL